MLTPQLSVEEIRKHLEARSRGPFRDVLARLLRHAPSDEAIAAQAEAHPDRWGQTLALVARLGGYNEKLEIEGSLSLQIQSLSDSELERTLAELQGTLDMQSSEHTTQPIDNASS